MLRSFVAIVLLAGCAHGKMGVVEQGLSKGSIPQGQKIYVEPILADNAQFTGDKAADVARLTEEKAEIKARFARLLADALRKKGFNATTSSVMPKTDLVLSGNVTRFEHGSGAARFMVGMGAGSSNLYTDFELVDAAKHSTLSKFEIIATSGGNSKTTSFLNAHLEDGSNKAAEYLANSNAGTEN